MERRITDRLATINATPNKNLGQHFLINEKAIEILENSVVQGGLVIEIGAGVGQLTEALAKRAGHVVAFEIDTRFHPVLSSIQAANSNIEIVYQSALNYNYQKMLDNFQGQNIQIIASLPYHITEPFIAEAVRLPVDEMILVTGKNFADEVFADIHDRNSKFGLLTLLANTFYKISLERELNATDFYPPPRTKSTILHFIPRTSEFFEVENHFLLRRLLLSHGGLIKNMLRDGSIAFADEQSPDSNTRALRRTAKQHTLTKNEARAKVEALGLPDEILNKSLSQLSNDELRKLSEALI